MSPESQKFPLRSIPPCFVNLNNMISTGRDWGKARRNSEPGFSAPAVSLRKAKYFASVEADAKQDHFLCRDSVGQTCERQWPTGPENRVKRLKPVTSAAKMGEQTAQTYQLPGYGS